MTDVQTINCMLSYVIGAHAHRQQKCHNFMINQLKSWQRVIHVACSATVKCSWWRVVLVGQMVNFVVSEFKVIGEVGLCDTSS